MSSTDDVKNDGKEMPSANERKVSARPHWKTRTSHLADVMPSVLEDVVARRSGMTLDMIAAWEEIAGPDYAKCTIAEKITWPRRASDLDPFQPGVLTVACDTSRAVFFQHEAGQVLERLNLFFGFEAVSKIRIVQKPVGRQVKKRNKIPEKLGGEKEARLADVMSHIEDPELRRKLERFGRGVMHRQQKSRKS